MKQTQPFFYDVTLRDGNQSLKRPWSLSEKEYIFNKLLNLGIQGIEVGFPNASQMDFEACSKLASIAPDNVVISVLARCVEEDILKAIEAVQNCAKPRLHLFISMSPFNMKYVLNKNPNEVRKKAVEAVKFAKQALGNKGEIQFSVEHFGDCLENLDWVIAALKEIVKAGASIINLPNTVERTRPAIFLSMVEKVKKALGKDVTIGVHCHNDLGMATAVTVESYFKGAIQLECCLNGLGERAGNTDFAQVAVALHNSDVNTGINLENIYETTLIVAEMAKNPIPAKSPLVGQEVLSHRSGIHQDGALKTKDMDKGAYRPINPALIGRKDDEKIGFTSQSGKTAIFEIIKEAGYPITMQEAVRITPMIKSASEKVGELPTRNIIDIYFNEVFNVKGPFKLISFEKESDTAYALKFNYLDKTYEILGNGNGPVASCFDALKQAGFNYNLSHYQQSALDEELNGSNAVAMSVMHFVLDDGRTIISRAKDENTSVANVKAIINGLNIIASLNN
ncbi:2-isopropylmalate synthase [bacterium]|nr:2-isopropylmalate synthase [bacterium]